jgi:uncharacterized protein (DUF924 family)
MAPLKLSKVKALNQAPNKDNITLMSTQAKKILDYWFGDLSQTPQYFRERNKLWFMGGKKVDDYIRKTFEKELDNAVQGQLKSWEDSPDSALALIILLDQFSLNLYRETPRSYTQSELAIPISRRITEQGWGKNFTL